MVSLQQFEKPCCRQVPYNSEESISQYTPFAFVYYRHLLSAEVKIKTMIMLEALCNVSCRILHSLIIQLYFLILEIIYSIHTYGVYVNVIFNACLCLCVQTSLHIHGDVLLRPLEQDTSQRSHTYIMCNQVFFSLLVFPLGCMAAWRTKDDKLHEVLKTYIFREVRYVGQIKSYNPLKQRDSLPTNTV